MRRRRSGCGARRDVGPERKARWRGDSRVAPMKALESFVEGRWQLGERDPGVFGRGSVVPRDEVVEAAAEFVAVEDLADAGRAKVGLGEVNAWPWGCWPVRDHGRIDVWLKKRDVKDGVQASEGTG